MTQSSVGAAAGTGANKAVEDMKGVDKATTDSNNVAIFTKMMKKAEESAEGAV